MSSRLRWTAFLMLASASVGGAQGHADLERRLDSLKVASVAANARLRAFDDSLAQARRAMQLLVVLPFRIHVAPDLAELARRAAELARADLRWSGTALDRVATREFVLRHETVRFGRQADQVESIVFAQLGPRGMEILPIWGPVDSPKILATWLRQQAVQALAADIDPDMKAWLETTAVFDSLPTGSWTGLRLSLVSFPPTIARQCFDRSLAACKKLLGLAPTADTLLEWFDAPTRRSLVVRSQQEYYRRRLATAATAECEGGSDKACVQVLRTGEIPLPTRLPSHRVSLLQHAIQMGGSGAVERLYEPAVTPGERLAHVARAPLDSIVSTWIERVHETRVPSDDLTPGIAFTSLAWIGIFGALALRSSRWR